MLTLLLLIAFACFALAFVLAAVGVSTGRINLIALGLACWVLVPLIGAWP